VLSGEAEALKLTMTVLLPALNPRQATIVIGALAATSRVIAEAYNAELGEARHKDYQAFAARILRDTRDAVFEGLDAAEENAIVEATEKLLAEALSFT